MNSKELAIFISELMLEKKGLDILVMDLRKLTSITDYFVICTASSDTQVKAISDNILEKSKASGVKPWHNEGYANLNWVLMDFVDVVAHIFLEETRKFYNIEGLWGDAEIQRIEDKKKPLKTRTVKRKSK